MKQLSILLFSILLISFSSCTKDDDDPTPLTTTTNQNNSSCNCWIKLTFQNFNGEWGHPYQNLCDASKVWLYDIIGDNPRDGTDTNTDVGEIFCY